MSQTPHAKCSCQNCGNHIEFPTEATGATVDCPHCDQPTVLALPAPEPAATADQLTTPELLSAFRAPIAPTPESFFYRLGLMLVSVMMVLLPLVYLAMIAAAVWGVYLRDPFHVPAQIVWRGWASVCDEAVGLCDAVVRGRGVGLLHDQTAVRAPCAARTAARVGPSGELHLVRVRGENM